MDGGSFGEKLSIELLCHVQNSKALIVQDRDRCSGWCADTNPIPLGP